MPSKDNLNDVYDELQAVHVSNRSKVVEQVLEKDQNFLKKLKSIFEEFEETKYFRGCRRMYLVVKALVCLADLRMMEAMLSDRNYMFVFGALEYNNELNKDEILDSHRKVTRIY